MPGDAIGLDALLWQPNERSLTRTWTDRSGRSRSAAVSLLEHWACALGDARNAIVHGEPSVDHDYGQNGSPYNGPFVEIADRVVREAITVILGSCGFPAAWRGSLARASLAALAEAGQLGGEHPT